MKKAKQQPDYFLKACEKLVKDNQSQFTEHHCKILLDLSEKLLASRTSEEIAEVERFIDTLLYERTEVVDVLNNAIDKGIPVGYSGFIHGKKFEYLAVQTRLLVSGIQHVIAYSTEESSKIKKDELIAWAESQAGKAIETAIEGYIDFLFPGKTDELMILLDIGFLGLLRRSVVDFDNNLKPVIIAVTEFLSEVPGVFNLIDAGIVEAKERAKSEAGSRAGSAGRKSLREVKAFAIQKYEAGKWQSAHHASIKLYSEVARLAGKNLSEARGQSTVYEWFLAHDKKKSK